MEHLLFHLLDLRQTSPLTEPGLRVALGRSHLAGLGAAALLLLALGLLVLEGRDLAGTLGEARLAPGEPSAGASREITLAGSTPPASRIGPKVSRSEPSATFSTA